MDEAADLDSFIQKAAVHKAAPAANAALVAKAAPVAAPAAPAAPVAAKSPKAEMASKILEKAGTQLKAPALLGLAQRIHDSPVQGVSILKDAKVKLAATDKKGAKHGNEYAAKGVADKHGGGANSPVSKAAQEAARRGAAKAMSGEVKAAQNTSGLLSKAAMEAAARASGLSPKKFGSMDVQDELNELRSELSVAVAALTSAQQRMERLEVAIQDGAAALTSSAA